MNDKMKRYAFLGFLGAVLFMIGDCLIFVYPGRNPELNVDPVYTQMPLWRFQATTILGWLGMIGMLFGFYSFYCAVRELCKPWLQKITLLSLGGVLGLAMAHFDLGALQPYVYKSVLEAGGDSTIAAGAAELVGGWNTWLDGIIIFLFYIQFLVLIYLIVSKKAKLSRWYLLLSPMGAILLGALWKTVFAGHTIAGTWGACESLGEGCIYLTIYFYWKKKTSTEER